MVNEKMTSQRSGINVIKDEVDQRKRLQRWRKESLKKIQAELLVSAIAKQCSSN